MISSINSLLSTATPQWDPSAKMQKQGEDFAAYLQDAMNPSPLQSSEIVDTFECSSDLSRKSEENDPSPLRDAIRNARKFAEEGQSPDAIANTEEDTEFREVFHQFVGQTLYGQMLKSMRETQDKPAYFHGGRAEEIFQGELDRVLVEQMTRATSDTLSDTMFELMKTPPM